MSKINTIMFFRNAYEDSSWSCMPFRSVEGFDSIQEMVEAIAKAFKRAIEHERENYWGNCWRCPISRREGLEICTKCGKDSAAPELTEEGVEEKITEVFEGTLQNLGELWEELQEEWIDSTMIVGSVGQVASIAYGPELIAKTMFEGFKVESTEYIDAPKSIKLYKNRE